MEEKINLDAGDGVVIRPWRRDDVAKLAALANDRDVWINLRDAFPHPYTESDAVRWVEFCRDAAALQKGFAITFNGSLAGGIGVLLEGDVHRIAAEIGYWLGQPFWNRGIMTRAVRAFSKWAMDTYALERLYCGIYEWNAASMRVLEKCGYVREGISRRAAIKDGKITDLHQFALCR